jgi:hypothetical protein
MNTLNLVTTHTAKWFHVNQLILNVDKINIVKFTPSNPPCNPMTTVYDSELTEVLNLNFTVLILKNI